LGDAFEPFLEKACRNILEVTEGAVYICMSSSELHTLQKAFVSVGGHWSTFIIWAKNTFTLGRSDYQRQYEPILYGWREGSKHYWLGDRDQGDVWRIEKPTANPLHPTMKPLALVERALENSSQPGNTVLDVFLGSGSTLIACERTGRTCYGMELEPLYVDIARMRWESFTSQKAIKQEVKQ
jgi:DNA modification methylase